MSLSATAIHGHREHKKGPEKTNLSHRGHKDLRNIEVVVVISESSVFSVARN